MTGTSGQVQQLVALQEAELVRLAREDLPWVHWLDAAARYGRYGFGNTLLIRAQLPEATDVRSFGSWKAAGRRVRKDETALKAVVKNEMRSLFDISQTEGSPLHQAQRCSPTEAWEALRDAAKALNLYVDRDTRWRYTGRPDRVISVDSELRDAEAARILAHQLAHVLRRGDRMDRAADLVGCHGQRRVEADSVAYLLLSHLTGAPPEIEFPRMTVWAGTDARARPVASIRMACDRLLRTASQVRRRLPDRPVSVASSPSAPRAVAPSPRGASEVSREELFAINAAAHTFYRDLLRSDDAHHYLKARGFPLAVQEKWQIGYSPPQTPSPLVAYLRTLRHSDQAIVASGLVVRTHDGRLRDRFRNRITFAIRDAEGLVRGFIGRRYKGSLGPKYLNSPDSALFHKGELLLGLHETRSRLAVGARPVIVEGPLDAIAINTASTGHAAVALCGTALTTAHVQALAAVGDLDRSGVVLALDGDKAGRSATTTAWPLLAQVKGPTGALLLPEGQDPADILRYQGCMAVCDSLQSEVALADVVVDAAIERFGSDLKTTEHRLAAARAAVSQAVLAPADQAAQQAARIVARTGVPPAVITDLLVSAVSPEAPPPARLAADGFPGPPLSGSSSPADSPSPPSRGSGKPRSL
ncbi:toprim domain-containing protein [Actinomadura hibisca]|uniref:toprim domain-containing protein n=1 Tax=Actinomadura hibisca TaxID=68565 RepID=UPI000829C4EE|nr:toprim domain-containing protein [Actinomadura hibisca]